MLEQDQTVTADMLRSLPEPVRRYLSYTGIVGKAWIDTARVRYSGKFRMGEERPWMPITAEQYYTTNPPGFVWKAQLTMAGLPLVHGDDRYKAGHGHMVGKLAGFITLFDVRGPELDQAGRVRYLNEMIWFPIAYLGENISWQSLDDCSAQVTFTDCGNSVSARMVFDELGRLTNFVAQRYREISGKFSLDQWSTPMDEYGVRAGLNLPVHASAVWNLPAGDLPYVVLTLSDVAYNVPVPAF